MTMREGQDLQVSDIFSIPGASEIEPFESLPESLDDLSSFKQQDCPSEQGGMSSQTAVTQLFNELEELASKHHVERSQCLSKWLRHQESVFAWLGPELSGQQVTAHHHCHKKEPSQFLDVMYMSAPTVGAGLNTAKQNTCVQAVKQTKPPGEPTELLSAQERALISERQISSNLKQRKSRKKKKNGFILSPGVVQENSRLQVFTSSRAYEIGSAALIAANSVTIGWQVQWSSERARDNVKNLTTEDTEHIFFKVLSAAFTIAFTVELGVRWVADGFLDFFRTDEFAWCIFDIFIVGVGLIELLLSLIFADSMPLAGEITLLRILRVMRIVKVLRVIRVMRFFRELRMMIWSIAGSLKSLVWVALVLTLLCYIFGIMITQGVEGFLSDQQFRLDPVPKDLIDYFGTLDEAMLSLFMAMSGGNDWSVYFDALRPLSIHYQMVFLLFIVFTIFAVVNIVTGVFVQSAMHSGNQDREIVVHEELENKRQYCEAMRQFFEEVDADGSGLIGYSEFTDKLNDERVLAYFNALKLDVSDAHTLFKLLDFDHSGEVEIEEFLVGCHKLQGESRNLDMKVMQLEVKLIQESLDQLSADIREIVGPEAMRHQVKNH